MLMMLASWGQVVQIGPADAHDAGFSGAMWHQLGPADANDAGFLGPKVVQIGLADAHDAGFLGPSGPNRPG